MKTSSKVYLLPQALSSFHKLFPKAVLEKIARQAEPRAYECTITPQALLTSFFIAYLRRFSGLRQVAAACSDRLQTSNHSSLTHALRRQSCLRFACILTELLEAACAPWRAFQLLALDSMPVTVAPTRRHNCRKYNSSAVGGGVLWSFAVEARGDQNPVRILRIIAGAWHDTVQVRLVELAARGPVYLMDRGFYALDLIAMWIAREVRFIVRARGKDLRFDVVRETGRPRTLRSGVQIELDAVVLLGSPKRRNRSEVRLVRAVLPGGDVLILVSNLFGWSGERLLEAYKKRNRIEEFHRLLKETVGLAHLYSFGWDGIEFLLRTAMLLTVVLWLGRSPGGETVAVLHRLLRQAREELGLGTKWKPNTNRPKRQSKKSRSKPVKPVAHTSNP